MGLSFPGPPGPWTTPAAPFSFASARRSRSSTLSPTWNGRLRHGAAKAPVWTVQNWEMVGKCWENGTTLGTCWQTMKMDENNKNGGQHADKNGGNEDFKVLKQLFTNNGDIMVIFPGKKIANGYVDGLYWWNQAQKEPAGSCRLVGLL